MSLCFKQDEVLKKELLYTLNLTLRNQPAACGTYDSKLIRMIAPNDCRDFSIGETKVGRYINYVLGPHFVEMVLNDFASPFFALSYDETRNINHSNELGFIIRYHSKTLKSVNDLQIATYYIGSGKADKMVSKIYEALEKNNLNTHNLVMLASDGPKVNLLINKTISEQIKLTRGHGLIDLPTCIVHTIHNTFKKCVYFPDIEELTNEKPQKKSKEKIHEEIASDNR